MTHKSQDVCILNVHMMCVHMMYVHMNHKSQDVCIHVCIHVVLRRDMNHKSQDVCIAVVLHDSQICELSSLRRGQASVAPGDSERV